ncbi:glycosyltransferase family 25 protein [Bradyrhizobium lablabi]|uniref:glycosyltransferase family 25 protein n=1 Tax=Bradyrhizobium lablabi TaxID=722472 RepID=UPI001BAAD356|nr:glycosyltransferase family 25 protein [Bradyrhizobium lablabi]MBR0697930.1 glycosyltransferase family 25 protein [Bradyrhizobium lablabi]
MATDATIPAFVINLDRDVERWQDISSALTRLGIPFDRIPAIDARKRMTLIRRVIRREFHFAPAGRPMKAGEIGCYLSHIAALKRIVRKNLPMAVIFEDDATFDQRFPQFYRRDLPHFLMKSDIVKFEGIHYAHTSKSGVSLVKGETAQLVVPLKPALGSAAYAVTRKGALDLIRALSVTDRPLDHKLVYYDRHGIDFAETQPFLVSQAAYESSIELRNLDAPPLQPVERLRQGLASIGRGARRIAYVARLLVKRRLLGAKSPSAA